MDIEYLRELDGHYLQLSGGKDTAAFERKMLQYAKPPGLLPLKIVPQAENCLYQYEISGQQSLSAMTHRGEMDEGAIQEALSAIYHMAETLQMYLLRSDGLCLEAELIFKDQRGWHFIYLPDRETDIFEQLQKLSQFLMRCCMQKDEKTVQKVYELFRICHEDNPSFSQILEIWDHNPAITGGRPQNNEKAARKLRTRLFRKKAN